MGFRPFNKPPNSLHWQFRGSDRRSTDSVKRGVTSDFGTDEEAAEETRHRNTSSADGFGIGLPGLASSPRFAEVTQQVHTEAIGK